MSNEIIMGLAMFGGQAILIATIHFGVKAFKSWFMSDVIKPHIEPMQVNIKTMSDKQNNMVELVAKHDAQIGKFTQYTLMLLGKVFGGIPNLELGDLDAAIAESTKKSESDKG